MVTATVSPAGCTAPSNSHLSVACLQVQGSDGPGECANGMGLVTAQVLRALPAGRDVHLDRQGLRLDR